MSIWKKCDSTGNLICGVCGREKGEREECCKTAPFIAFKKFVSLYFPEGHHDPESDDKEHFVPLHVAEAFYEDYLHSSYDNIEDYIENTQKKVDE